MNPEELCSYINDLILKDFPQFTEEQIQEKCADVLAKYSTLNDKFTFDFMYENSFLNRLAIMREKCLEFDGAIINEIRKVKPTFMHNLDSIKDNFSKSKEMNDEFEKVNDDKRIHFNPLIMKSSICPFNSTKEIPNTPFTNYSHRFTDFCESKNDKMKYEINNTLSMCELSITIGEKEYIVKSNFYVSTILLSLIEKSMTFIELVQRLNSDKAYVGKLILQLHKLKLIKRTGEDKILKDGDVLSFNTNFVSPNKHIIIPVYYKRNDERTIGIVEIEKEESIKYCIIRLLKQRSKMEKDELIGLVIQKLNNSFIVTTDQVIKILELKLIDNYVRKEVIDGKETYTYIG